MYGHRLTTIGHWFAAFALLATTACTASHGLPPRVATSRHLAIVGGAVYTSPDAAPLADAVVLVEEGIAAVDKRGAFDLRRAQILDASGGTVMAGFQNSHVHFTEPEWQEAAHLPKGAVSDAIASMLTRFRSPPSSTPRRCSRTRWL